MAPTCGALLRLYPFCCDGEGPQESHQVWSRHVLTISCHLGLERAFSMFNLECFGRFTDDRDVALLYFQPIKVIGSQVVKSFVLQRLNNNSWTIVGKLQHNFWFLSLCCKFAAVHAECCNATGLHFLTLSAFIHSYRSYSSPSPAPLPCIPLVTRSSSRCPSCFRSPVPPCHFWSFSLQSKLTLSCLFLSTLHLILCMKEINFARFLPNLLCPWHSAEFPWEMEDAERKSSQVKKN